VGLQLRKAADRFGEDDFIRAIHDYTEECADCDFPLSLETYDRWVTAEVSLGGDRPSAMEMIAHYGGWQEALSTIPGFEAKRGLPGSDSDCYDPAMAGLIQPLRPPGCAQATSRALANVPRHRSSDSCSDTADGSVVLGYPGCDVWCSSLDACCQRAMALNTST
jgi:hypothetical protein